MNLTHFFAIQIKNTYNLILLSFKVPSESFFSQEFPNRSYFLSHLALENRKLSLKLSTYRYSVGPPVQATYRQIKQRLCKYGIDNERIICVLWTFSITNWQSNPILQGQVRAKKKIGKKNLPRTVWREKGQKSNVLCHHGCLQCRRKLRKHLAAFGHRLIFYIFLLHIFHFNLTFTINVIFKRQFFVAF